VPTESELDRFVTLILSEVQASRHLEDILYTSRQRGRSKYTLLHKPLVLEWTETKQGNAWQIGGRQWIRLHHLWKI